MTGDPRQLAPYAEQVHARVEARRVAREQRRADVRVRAVERAARNPAPNRRRGGWRRA